MVEGFDGRLFWSPVTCHREITGFVSKCKWQIFTECCSREAGTLESFLTVYLPREIMWNVNLMQQGNFINVFLARHVSGTYAHHQEHYMLSCSIWFSAPSFWMVCGCCRARQHPHRPHDQRSGSQGHHPSKHSVQKTVCCNSTSNAPDDGRMYPKNVELRIY